MLNKFVIVYFQYKRSNYTNYFGGNGVGLQGKIPILMETRVKLLFKSRLGILYYKE